MMGLWLAPLPVFAGATAQSPISTETRVSQRQFTIGDIVTYSIFVRIIYQEQIQKSMEKRELKSSRRKRWTERFQWLIFAGLLCLAGEPLVREK